MNFGCCWSTKILVLDFALTDNLVDIAVDSKLRIDKRRAKQPLARAIQQISEKQRYQRSPEA